MMLYRWKWLDALISKYFKGLYAKKFIKKYPHKIHAHKNSDGKITYVIDLTELFGHGNEPSREVMDKAIVASEEYINDDNEFIGRDYDS